ncbi:MAG: caspase family protein [Myxococcaceae bacterium]
MKVTFALLLCLLPTAALGQKRTALLVGANTGWAVDRPLRHAVDDARRLASTLLELGDFATGDVQILEDPTTEQLREALRRKLADPSALFLFFYSGHADDKHLHLRGAPLSFDELNQTLRANPATLKLGFLDACRAGSILAAKGGKPISPFNVKLQDELTVRGLAWITSSGADELSQETRALQGSVFTHHLISALRGAADDNHDGRISLPEAYAYASSRTTLDTAATATGAQRPSFRYELNGRGDVFLTRLAGQAGLLVFPARDQRCWVTDAAQRQLFAEVPATGSTLALRPDDYVLKCMASDQYAVTAVTLAAGQKVDVSKLIFRPLPLSEGLVKGQAGLASEDPLVARKREGFQKLEAGLPDDALRIFDEALNKDLRDSEAYRGKAQALLALAVRAREQGNNVEANRLTTVAVRTDPRLEGDPSLPQLPKTVFVPKTQAQLNTSNLEGNYPRRYQQLGLGLGFASAHGFFDLTLDWNPLLQLQLTLHLSPFIVGAGAEARWVFLDRAWSPYAGVGINGTLAGLGVISGPVSALTLNNTIVSRRSTYDFVLYGEGGVQLMTRHFAVDLGIAVGRIAPRGGAPGVGVFPVLALKYFF